MKELDAALSGMLQSSSELETDGSSVTNTPSDTQKASRPPQAVEQFATSLASTTTVPPQQAPPPTAQPIIALPRPPQYASGRRRQKGGGTPGPLSCLLPSQCSSDCIMHACVLRLSVHTVYCIACGHVVCVLRVSCSVQVSLTVLSSP